MDFIELFTMSGMALTVFVLVFFLFYYNKIITSQYEKEISELKRRYERKSSVDSAYAYSIGEVHRSIEFDEECEGTSIHARRDMSSPYSFDALKIPISRYFKGHDIELGEITVHQNFDEPNIEVEDFEIKRGSDFVYQEAKISIESWDTERHPNITFHTTQDFRGIFCRTQSECMELYSDDSIKDEYTSIEINVPIDTLFMEIDFPESYVNVDPHPLVFFQETEEIYRDETARAKKQFDFYRSTTQAKLNIDNPSLGLIYAIAWTPPKEEELSVDIS